MSSDMVEPLSRTVGGSEYSWCRAVPGGTGVAVLALLGSKTPDISRLQTALHQLQNSHPILRSRLHVSTTNATFSFFTSPTPFVKIQSYNLSATSKLLRDHSVSPFQQILEHELNQNNTWHNPTNSTSTAMFFASIYALPNAACAVVLRLHVSACDRTTAASLLQELLVLMNDNEGSEGTGKQVSNNKGEVTLSIEDLIGGGKAKKAIWTRGMDMLGYTFNSLKLTNLKFHDTKNTRCSQVVRLQLNQNDTERILDGCRQNGIKLCGALTAAGLMAAHGTKRSYKKYGVVTLIDCRSTLDPPLSLHNFGFYHSAILNTHVMKGGESLWEVGKRIYGALANSKKCHKHFTDMAELNFLMRKAIENPGLTSSSSLRTSIMSVFEESVIEDSGEKQREVGVEDFMGCASVHGVGPSIALFDTIRDGRLDCVCVYPAPLHSREQMQELASTMKAILIEAGKDI